MFLLHVLVRRYDLFEVQPFQQLHLLFFGIYVVLIHNQKPSSERQNSPKALVLLVNVSHIHHAMQAVVLWLLTRHQTEQNSRVRRKWHGTEGTRQSWGRGVGARRSPPIGSNTQCMEERDWKLGMSVQCSLQNKDTLDMYCMYCMPAKFSKMIHVGVFVLSWLFLIHRWSYEQHKCKME